MEGGRGGLKGGGGLRGWRGYMRLATLFKKIPFFITIILIIFIALMEFNLLLAYRGRIFLYCYKFYLFISIRSLIMILFPSYI